MHALTAHAAVGAWPLARARQLAMARRAVDGSAARTRLVAARAGGGGPAAGPGASSRAAPNHQARAAVATPPPPVEQEEAAPAAPAAVDDGGAEGGSAWDRLLAQVTSRRFRALAMLNAMTLLLAANWAILKSANDAGIASDMSLDPSTFTAMRFLLASVLFSGSLKQGFGDRAVVRAGTEMGAWCAAGYVTQCVALSMTPASRASLLSTFTVLIVPVFAALKGQKIKPLVWGCAGAAVLGTLLLEAGSSEPPNVGDAWAILSAAAFAAQLFRTEMLTADLPPSSSLPLMAVSMTTIAGITAAVAGIADWRDAASTADALGNMAGGVADVIAAGHPVGAPHAAGLLAAGQLAFTAFLSTALALLLELVALKDVSSTEAALVYSLEPVVGASLSCLFLGERFGPTGLAGAAIIMAAAVTTQVLGAPQGPEAAGGGGGEGASSSSS